MKDLNIVDLSNEELQKTEGGYWIFGLVVDAILISAGHHETLEEYGLTN